MSLRRLEWAVAAGAAGWAAARLAGADRAGWGEAWSVPLLSFTPQVASVACGAALLMRGRGSSAVTGVAGAALAAAVVPRAVPGRRAGTGGVAGTAGTAGTGGPVLRVLTVNLLHGQAEPAAVVGLVRDTGADVLFVQELTGGSAAGLGRHGIDDLLPHHEIDPAGRDTGIYTRHPLTGEPGPPGAAGEPGWARRPGGWHTPRNGPCWSAARFEPAPGRSVRLVCVHTHPPLPPWQAGGTAAWRTGLAGLPGPGGIPVIMAGDFNATLDHAQFRRLLGRGYTDAAAQTGRGLVPTWGPEPTARPPLLTIDHVLTDSRCTARATSVHPVAGTDHRALYAEVRLPG